MLELWYAKKEKAYYPEKDTITHRVAYMKDDAIGFRFLGQQSHLSVENEEMGILYDLMQEIGQSVEYALMYGTGTDAGYQIWLSVREKLKTVIHITRAEIKPMAIVIDGHKESII